MRRVVRLCVYTLTIVVLPGLMSAAVVRDRVELQGRGPAGMPFYPEPRSTDDSRRVPNRTVATVIDLAHNGQWLRLPLAEEGSHVDALGPGGVRRPGDEGA